MMEFKNEDIKILGRLVSIAVDNIIADASLLWDSNLEEDQETINRQVRAAIALIPTLPLLQGEGTGSIKPTTGGNTTNGPLSIAMGEGLTTTNQGEAAFGNYNNSKPGMLFSIGNGGDWGDTVEHSNAFEVYQGNTYIDGVGGYDGTNSAASNVKPVNQVINDIQTDITSLQSDIQKTIYVSEITNLSVAGQAVSIENIPETGAIGTIDWAGFAASGCKILMLVLKDTGKYGEIPMTCYMYNNQMEKAIFATADVYHYDYIHSHFSDPSGFINVAGTVGSDRVTVYFKPNSK